jgi:hypothetical protein
MNDRARIPFALIGVLLLVSSATYAGSLGRPVATEPRVTERMETLSAETGTAVREATRRAALQAGTAPVTDAANSSVGRALGKESTFRAALRLRIYTRTRQALAGLDRRQGRLHVSASLPTPEGTEAVREAVGRVHVARAGPDGTLLRATVENVTLTVRREGRVVGREVVSPTVTVDVPVLAVHGRVARFERRLDAGPLDPGLGRRLTAALYPVAWARGHAQYRGTPIENVVANRHVALVTNRAVLALQEETFGSSDPVGRRALRRATAEVGVTDLLTGTGTPTLKRLERARQRATDTSPLPEPRLTRRAQTSGPSPSDPVTIGINATADRAFLRTHDSLGETVEATYTATVRRRVGVERRGSRWERRPSTPGSDWTLVGTDTETSVAVTPGESGQPSAPDGWHVLASYTREVTRTRTVVRTWSTPEGTERTRASWSVRFAVGIDLFGRHEGGPAPPGPIEGVHSRGGPLDGPNLADIRGKAHRELVAERGGVDGLARAAAAGEVDGTVERAITGARPPELRAWVYADLADLRRTVANLSVTTTRGSVATFGTNPAAALRAKLRERRQALVDRPQRYAGVADRARVAARVAYLDRVSTMLAARAEARRERRRAVADRLPGSDGGRLHATYRNRSSGSDPADPPVRMVVDARPSYLTVSALGPDGLPSVRSEGHPLAVRNTNLVALPYADAAGPVVDAFLGSEQVRLRTAAAVLDAATAAERTGLARGDHRRLREAVSESADALEARMASVLADAEFGPASDRQAVVDRALARWQRPSARAMALANGSAAEAVQAATAREWSVSPRERDLLGLRLDRAVRRGLESDAVRVSAPTTERVGKELRAALQSKVRRQAEEATRRAAVRAGRRIGSRVVSKYGKSAGRLLAVLPAGVPVAPLPGLWYATVNLWSVDVRGTYAQFVVRVPRGSPDTVGGFRYVRDGDTVSLDADGDGEPERLGRAERIEFATETEIVVGVPPGPQGVGDVDGNRAETSPGWPAPGWK